MQPWRACDEFTHGIRRPRQERLKREGKSVNLSSATVPRLRKTRPGGACSQMESDPKCGRQSQGASGELVARMPVFMTEPSTVWITLVYAAQVARFADDS